LREINGDIRGNREPASAITITTDFGTADGYVATMKGIILGINPNARLIDVTHEIKPQNISEASFILSTVYRYFPVNTVHLAVVDPGVGTVRRGIILRTAAGFFVGPDNGLFTLVLSELFTDRTPVITASGKMKLPPGVTAINLTNREYWHQPVSFTFQGRDIFAPVAAHLSLGVPLEKFGETIKRDYGYAGVPTS
jgi:S-adenosyl-L-methionine hydrolase (adenosine-forming)